MRITSLLLSLLLVSCASTPLETIVAPADLEGWKVGNAHDGGPGKNTIVEYIPAADSIRAWSQIATIQSMPNAAMSPKAAMEQLRDDVQNRCPGVDWSIVVQDDTSITYEWRIEDCAGQKTQHELARLMQGNDGLHRIAYAKKVAKLDAKTRDRWLKVLAGAYVVLGGPDNPIVLLPKDAE